MTGQEQADSGSFKVGETVVLGYVDQLHDDLNPEQSVWENIMGGHDNIVWGNRTMNDRDYVAKLKRKGAEQQKKGNVGAGGESNRVQKAKKLKKRCKVLLLDEITNDKDVNTIGASGEG